MELDHAKLDHVKLRLSSFQAKFPSGPRAKLRLSSWRSYDPAYSGSKLARDKASGAKLLVQPLAGLNGKLLAKLIVRFKARLPSLGETFSFIRSYKYLGVMPRLSIELA